jgi:hypothetical protein
MPAGVSAITALANLTLSSSASTVTFSSISGSYRDLILVVTAKSSQSGWESRIKVNGDTGTNYSVIGMYNSGSSANGYAPTTQSVMKFGFFGILSTSASVQWVTHFIDYSATDKHKTVISQIGNATDALIDASTNRWANTSAITEIVAFPGSGTWSAGSTFALYGVSA